MYGDRNYVEINACTLKKKETSLTEKIFPQGFHTCNMVHVNSEELVLKGEKLF